jgi:hypothetical protein
MTSRLLLRTALNARSMTTLIGRAYVSRPALISKTMLPSLTLTIPQLRTFTVALPRFSNGEGKI